MYSKKQFKKMRKKPSKIALFLKSLRERYINDEEIKLATIFGSQEKDKTHLKRYLSDREDKRAEIVKMLSTKSYREFFYAAISRKFPRKFDKVRTKIQILTDKLLFNLVNIYYFLFEHKVWVGRKKLSKIKTSVILSQKKMDKIISSLSLPQMRERMLHYNMITKNDTFFKQEDYDIELEIKDMEKELEKQKVSASKEDIRSFLGQQRKMVV